ncbi:ATP12 family protein [Komagataeibacter rhaeticus]|nr:ATP12 family protein [Komagataeibacter rhaeticus]
MAGGGFGVELDGRGIRLPGGTALVVHSAALADAIAAEWARAGGEKGGNFTPDDLPMTRIAGTMIERVAPDPAAQVTALCNMWMGNCCATAPIIPPSSAPASMSSGTRSLHGCVRAMALTWR